MVDDLRRITRAYAKNIGGLPIISVLPRKEYQKKDRPQLEDSVLVEYLEELVEAALQEVDQPLNQMDPVHLTVHLVGPLFSHNLILHSESWLM